MGTIHDSIAADLRRILRGSVLRCLRCGNEFPTAQGRVPTFFDEGWPVCCGATMRLLTAKQLKAGKP